MLLTNHLAAWGAAFPHLPSWSHTHLCRRVCRAPPFVPLFQQHKLWRAARGHGELRLLGGVEGGTAAKCKGNLANCSLSGSIPSTFSALTSLSLLLPYRTLNCSPYPIHSISLQSPLAPSLFLFPCPPPPTVTSTPPPPPPLPPPSSSHQRSESQQPMGHHAAVVSLLSQLRRLHGGGNVRHGGGNVRHGGGNVRHGGGNVRHGGGNVRHSGGNYGSSDMVTCRGLLRGSICGILDPIAMRTERRTCVCHTRAIVVLPVRTVITAPCWVWVARIPMSCTLDSDYQPANAFQGTLSQGLRKLQQLQHLWSCPSLLSLKSICLPPFPPAVT
ncbi:unnamed protein product [Closterium sp. NIES-65]|nr:unnamed protein product [Closterium sp. NIES-65]